MRVALINLVVIFTLAGCANQATLTVHTQPAGGFVTEPATGFTFGIAPSAGYYNLKSMTPNANGCYIVNGLQAQWSSGAVTTLDSVSMCLGPTANYSITINRDPNHSGLDKDLQFAAQLQLIQAQQQQAGAASTAAAAAFFGGVGGSTTCRTTPIGNSVYTNCN